MSPTLPLRCRVLLLPLALLLGAAGCRRGEPTPPAAAGPAVAVAVAPVEVARLPAVVEVPATVRPVERALIAAKLTGTVTFLPWSLGQSVAAGAVLVRLSAPENEARVRQAKAQLDEAVRTERREQELVTKGVNPTDALAAAEERLRYAHAALAEAQALLAHAEIRAPFGGTVAEKLVLPGDLATPGLPLLILENPHRLRAETAIPDTLASGLAPGHPLRVAAESGVIIEAVLEELSFASDSTSHSRSARILLPDDAPVYSGQFVRVLLSGNVTEALTVPASALTLLGQMERVFVIADGRAVLRIVKSGRQLDGRVEILSGLNPGEQVVLAPPAALRDGSFVRRQP